MSYPLASMQAPLQPASLILAVPLTQGPLSRPRLLRLLPQACLARSRTKPNRSFMVHHLLVADFLLPEVPCSDQVVSLSHNQPAVLLGVILAS